MVSAQCKQQLGRHAPQAIFHTLVCRILSHSDVAYLCVLWDEEMGSYSSFNCAPQFCWCYYLGDDQRARPSVPMTFFIKVYR